MDAAIATAFGDDESAEASKELGTRGIVVLRDGQLIGERYAPGFSAQTPQLGWSMGKSVTNLLVGRLVLEGRIALSDRELRPEWTDERRIISVDQLLRMTSGLTWDETYALGTPITRMLYAEGDMAAYAASQPLAHQPGTYQQYSSGSTNIPVRRPHRASRTSRTPTCRASSSSPPSGWRPRRGRSTPWGTPARSSYLWATPREWAAIGQFALQDGCGEGERLLPEGWMQQSTTATPVDSSEEKGYAAGWWVNRQADGTLVNPALPEDAYWAQGHDGQRLYVVPSARLVVARLGFTPEVEDIRTDELVGEARRARHRGVTPGTAEPRRGPRSPFPASRRPRRRRAARTRRRRSLPPSRPARCRPSRPSLLRWPGRTS